MGRKRAEPTPRVDIGGSAMAMSMGPSAGISSALPQPRMQGGTLVIPPFTLRKGRQRFVLPTELAIELATLEPGVYRVIAVQNFWIEDHDPDLERSLAGIFLARRRLGGGWEEPEAWPVECRSLEVLGILDSHTSSWILAGRE